MKKVKKSLACLFLLMLLCAVSACNRAGTDSGNAAGGETETQTEAQTETQTEAQTETQTEAQAVEKPTKDRNGNPITIPDQVENVIVMAPSIAETLMDLGCEELITAIDTQTQGYAYEQLPADLPAFDMMAPNTEQMAALKPDVVFVSGMTDISGADLYADLKELGICVINIPSSSGIQGVKDDISFIAACMGKAAEGEKIIADLTAAVDRIGEIGKTITEKKTVYFEIAAAPDAYSFGSGVFLNEMIETIGAQNLLADQEGWLTVDLESVVAANPDVILTNVNYIEDPVNEILSRDGWKDVAAVKNGEVFYIDNQSTSLPNENIVKALEEMAAAVYPDYYEK